MTSVKGALFGTTADSSAESESDPTPEVATRARCCVVLEVVVVEAAGDGTGLRYLSRQPQKESAHIQTARRLPWSMSPSCSIDPPAMLKNSVGMAGDREGRRSTAG